MKLSERIYFISEHSIQDLNHGGIGPADIETILLEAGAIPIRFPFHFEFSLKAKTGRFYHLVKTFLTLNPHSIVIFQHPLYAKINRLLLHLLRLRKSITVICLVADIDGLKDGNNDVLQKEKACFKKYEYFILHNPNMERWLMKFHPTAYCSLLTCFDFLAQESRRTKRKSNTIVFAGNLQKSKFLHHLDLWLQKNESLRVHLYGPHIMDEMLTDRRVQYKGEHHPYALPDLLEGSFGLIWDGERADRPAGSLGEYMQYITHHKLSLYIVSRLPVILYENAGSAELVKGLGIGFTVNNLFEIEDKINTLSEEDYNRMAQNMHDLAIKITSGNCLRTALHKLLEQIKTTR